MTGPNRSELIVGSENGGLGTEVVVGLGLNELKSALHMVEPSRGKSVCRSCLPSDWRGMCLRRNEDGLKSCAHPKL